mgnify:FL=1
MTSYRKAVCNTYSIVIDGVLVRQYDNWQPMWIAADYLTKCGYECVGRFTNVTRFQSPKRA